MVARKKVLEEVDYSEPVEIIRINVTEENPEGEPRLKNGGELPPNVFLANNGWAIATKRVSLLYIESVTRSVKMPKKPTYETRLPSGKVEEYLLDEKSAAKTVGGKERLEYYKEELDVATSVSAERMMRAVLLKGTLPPLNEDFDPEWEREMRIIGLEIASDPLEKWVQYLLLTLGAESMTNLSLFILRSTMIPEEEVAAAQQSFRYVVHTKRQPELVGEAGGLGKRNPKGKVAA